MLGFIGLCILALIAQNQQWLKRADYIVFDSQVRTIAAQREVNSDIVVIALDDKSLIQMNDIAGRWVWPRSVHAELIDSLRQFQPKAIAFDILFAEKDRYRPDADAYFNEVLRETDNVFFSMLMLNGDQAQGTLLSSLKYVTSITQARGANVEQRALLLLPKAIERQNWSRLGTINFNAEFDGVGRYYDVQRSFHSWQFLSLAALITQHQNVTLPTADRVLLNWSTSSSKSSQSILLYNTFSYVDVYKAVVTNDENFLKQFTGKTIFIGATAAGLYDARVTPVSNNLPGVYMLATAFDNLMHGDFFQVQSNVIHYGITLFLMSVIFLCFSAIKGYSYKLIGSLISILLTGFLVHFISLKLMQTNQVVFIAFPIIAMVLCFISYSLRYGYLEFIKRREALTMFGRFLDPKVVQQLLNEGKLSENYLNKKSTVTVLFSDIRGFTSLSERQSAEEVLMLLNRYFSMQVSVIFSTQGTLDKFIGDCIMAFWGAPIGSHTQARDAIETALLMEENLLKFKQSLPDNLQAFDIGIGIHTGDVVAGLVGTEQRVDYTVIGDAVNLASRVESLTKTNTRILVSENTMLQASEYYHFEYQGEFHVKGRDASVKLFTPTRK